MEDTNMFLLEKITPDISVFISNQGLIIKSNKGFNYENYKFTNDQLKKATKFGIRLNEILSILLEKEIAEIINDDIVILPENVKYLYDIDYGLLGYLPDYCPFTLELETRSWFGDKDFRYDYKFIYGNQEVFIKRFGCFIKKTSSIYCLTDDFYILLEEIDKFNRSDTKDKNIENSLMAFSKIKSLASEVEAKLDSYIRSNQVIIPEKVELGLEQDSNGRVTVYPVFKNVPEETIKNTYLGLTDAQSIYDLETHDTHGRIRIVLNPEVNEVIKKMKPLNRLSGKEKDKLVTSPRDIFSEDCVDLSNYGPRVKGIGPYVFQPKIVVKCNSGFLDGEDIFRVDSSGNPVNTTTIEAEDSEGSRVVIPIPDIYILEDIYNKVTEANKIGVTTIKLEDNQGKERIIPVTPDLIKGINCLAKKTHILNHEKDIKNDPDKRFVLIYENEENSEYSEFEKPEDNPLKELKFIKPFGLRDDIELKSYQKDGIAWLQNSLSNGNRRGVLLADEMGLGKTLQVLTFLSWYIENNFSNSGPYQPILIVAPLILLSNWNDEIRKFFKNDGAVFDPCLIFHDKIIKEYKLDGLNNCKESDIGTNILDINKLVRNRIIITNYDTVKNYQHSFAKVEWSIVITDESQEIKESQTAVTHAVKSLNTNFRIAMTGTPVENRLLDLWCIIDFVQPGLLGTAKEFNKNIESNFFELSDEERNNRINQLKKSLKYSETNAYIIHRKKADSLPDIPRKIEQSLECGMTKEQEDLHIEIVSSVKDELFKHKKGRHLTAIQSLAKMYEHIDLYKPFADIDPKHYLERSPKLELIRDELRKIKSKKEKALVFTRSIKMQQILKKVFDKEFNLETDIINGSISTKTTQRGENTRTQYIKKFEAKDGFNIIILSPEVAGVGLNITGANHVIHYGRWWNPAKEAQATDRAYRIGQEKDVYVYYPISVSNRFTSFDSKLQQLLDLKKSLGQEILTPTYSLNVSETDIFEGLVSDENQNFKDIRKQLVSLDEINLLDPYSFEAFIAAIYEKQGYKTILTPKSNDGGVDVIAIKGKTITLIQCKHSQTSRSKHNSDVINEISTAFNYYRRKFPQDYRYDLCCIVNTSFLKDAKDKARNKDITLIEGKDIDSLIKQHSPTRFDISLMEERRKCSLEEVFFL